MRLIDADELELEAYALWAHETLETKYIIENLKRLIDKAPTIEATEVVRCKHCKYRGTGGCTMIYSGFDGACDWTMDDGFCHCGERRDWDG